MTGECPGGGQQRAAKVASVRIVILIFMLQNRGLVSAVIVWLLGRGRTSVMPLPDKSSR